MDGPPHAPLALDRPTRRRLWDFVVDQVEGYASRVHDGPVKPVTGFDVAADRASGFDLASGMDPVEAVGRVCDGLWRGQLHCAHRRHFGLFNPTPTAMGVAAEALAAAFNPQLAARGHAPFPVEAEDRLVRELAGRLGFDPEASGGSFTTGGAEANHTALLAALAAAWPGVAGEGLAAADARPTLYVSEEGHHSVTKAARASGLGDAAVRTVATDGRFRMDPGSLESRLREDRGDGRSPFLVVATAGSTATGAIDPLRRIGEIARREGCWLHVDAAWGGAACLLPEGRAWLDGIAGADSVTMDPHKWLSVPLGAGLFVTRHRDVPRGMFGVETGYVPEEGRDDRVPDPYAHTLQWSRRFSGLKVLLSVAVAGWDGYARALEHQVRMGDLLRERLEASGWRVVNHTPLPVVCFVPDPPPGPGGVESICRHVVESGDAWLSHVRLGDGRRALRACVTSYLTRPEDVEALLGALDRARAAAVDHPGERAASPGRGRGRSAAAG